MPFRKLPCDPFRYPQPFTHLLVVDFEATCVERPQRMYPPQEIIEFPIVVVDLTKTDPRTKLVVPSISTHEFQSYVKPTIHPVLSDFCVELTGIQQEWVDRAEEWTPVWNKAQLWIKNWEEEVEKTRGQKPKWAFVTCGDWDLNTMLPTQQARGSGAGVPAAFQQWVNVKVTFKLFYRLGKWYDMIGMLKWLDLTLEGRQHSGIDDSRNIARIVKKMVEHGCVFQTTAKKYRSNYNNY